MKTVGQGKQRDGKSKGKNKEMLDMKKHCNRNEGCLWWAHLVKWVWLKKKITECENQSVQWLIRVWLFATPWTAACQASLSITNSRSLLKLMSIELVMHPTISTSVIPFSSRLQSTHLQGLFNESVLCKRWPKYWSFSFNISPSNEYAGLISFKMDCFDLAV